MFFHLFNCDFLGSSFIRLNQSAIRPKIQQEILIKNEHQGIFDKVQSRLMAPPYQIPRTNSIFKQYSSRLLDHFNQSYFAPIPYKDQLLAHEQAHIAQSIRDKIKKHNLMLRVVDKGNSFYIGSAKNFEQKVQKYFTDTNAFVSLSENPFDNVFNRVSQTLKTMASKKFISQGQMKEMLPNQTTSVLSHLYFNPKIHKVSEYTSLFMSSCKIIFYFVIIGWHTSSSHSEYYSSSNSTDF